MQDLLTASLLAKLSDLPFISQYGGLVQTIKTVNTLNKERRWPSIQDGTPITPDSKQKGILYFEHRRLDVKGVVGTSAQVESTLLLVFWGNLSAAGVSYNGAYNGAYSHNSALAPALAQAAIMKRVPLAMHNVTPLFKVTHSFGRILLPQDGLFDKYTFSEIETQYLMSPFTAFGIEIKSSFNIPLNCIPQ